jgi:16S rRNA (uracil1498-N3)-methyltransferase
VNLLLLDAADVPSERAKVTLTDRRADHIRSVLRASVGDRIRVGRLDGLIGSARLTEISTTRVVLDVVLDIEPPPASPHILVLGLPRPKALRRTLVHAVSLGVKRIFIINGFNVDKSYWDSPLLGGDSIREALITGLEQARDTALPAVELKPRFKPFVEDELVELLENRKGFVAAPSAETPCPTSVAGPCVVAVGPDRGFTEYEESSLAAVGMSPVSLGPRTLRVETSVPAILGRLAAS